MINGYISHQEILLLSRYSGIIKFVQNNNNYLIKKELLEVLAANCQQNKI